MTSASGLRNLFAPLTPLYRFGLALRERRLASGREPIRRLRFPVISIGNLSTGGAGKTPLTIALAQALSRRGFAVDVLSRGYKRQSTLAARVDPAGTAEEFGDEPLLIARRAGVPVYVAPQRYDAGFLAESVGFERAVGRGFIPGNSAAESGRALAPEVPCTNPSLAPDSTPQKMPLHLLDDGFQHRQLHRDVDILLIDRADWQDRLLPAGNLREDLRAALRTSVIAIPDGERELRSSLRTLGWNGPVWRIRRRMEIPVVEGPALAFCGIARPEQFFTGLEAAGMRLIGRRAFPDHYRYTSRDLEGLAAQARAAGGSALVTTEKDEVRLARLRTSMPVVAAPLISEIECESGALDWMMAHLKIPHPE